MDFSFSGLHTTHVQCDLSWPAKTGSAFFAQVSWQWHLPAYNFTGDEFCFQGVFTIPAALGEVLHVCPGLLDGVWRGAGPLT